MKTFHLTAFVIISVILVIPTIGVTQTSKNSFTISLGLSDEGYGYPNHLADVPTNILPTVNLYGEYYLSNVLSIGVYGAYTYSYYKFHDFTYPSESYKDAWQGWDFGLRYAVHLSPIFIKNEKIDLYLSAFSGYTKRSLVYDKKNIYRDSLNYNTDAFSVGGILGVRYFISKEIGVFGEVGFSRKAFLGGGVTYQILSKTR